VSAPAVTWTRAEVARYCHLRAIEWASWPAFLAQPVIPLAYLFGCKWWTVLIAAALATFAWAQICLPLVNIRAANVGVYFVWLKWLTIPPSCLILAVRGEFALAGLALATPVVVSFLNFPFLALRVGGPSIGAIEWRFFEKAAGRRTL
jgi:hypothetical protein